MVLVREFDRVSHTKGKQITKRAPRKNTRRGFTLIEFLVGISIVVIFAALIIPVIQFAGEAARKTQCKNNLSQIGIALYAWSDTDSQR